MPIVMGTAGHIDHGKTTLVRALTGIDCDRLAEEKKRGITIELGFAYLDLGNTRIGIVDVPGHEKFVKNMVSGAVGIDFVLLVIAADEGVMPQTKEHVEICSLLGISKGIVALTKVDMVEEEWLELVQEDIKEFLASTFLKDAPIVPVSSTTGQGLEELKATIEKMVAAIKQEKPLDVFRLPIDRVFTLHGHGTVITGTTLSGRIKVGEEVQIYPGELLAKIRNIQVHSESKEEALAGQRTAVNLQGVEKDKIERGDILARPGSLFPSTTWTVKIDYLSSAPRPLKHRSEIHFHHGCKEVMARVYLLEKDELSPGESALAQIRFAQPMVALFGDRFVLRSFSPLQTVGGGKVLDPLATHLKRKSKEILFFKEIEQLNPEEVVAGQIKRSGFKGIDINKLLVLTNFRIKELEKYLQKLCSEKVVFLVSKDKKLYMHLEIVKEIKSNILNYLKEFHKSNPLEEGVSRNEVYSSLDIKIDEHVFSYILNNLKKDKQIEIVDKYIKIYGYEVKVHSDSEKIYNMVLNLISKGKLTPPTYKELKEKVSCSPKELNDILRLLEKEGKVVRLNENIVYAKQVVEELLDKLTAYFEQQQELTPADFKALTGLSRKYSIPLLEYFDKEKITMRIGDKRVLRKKA